MDSQYLGQIAVFSFGFIPTGWAACNGQLLSIAANNALFTLLGTTYGGDGIKNFALPNLQAAFPIGTGSSFAMAQAGGEGTHMLMTNEMPAHTHIPVGATSNGTAFTPVGMFPGGSSNQDPYGTSPDTLLDTGANPVGNGQAHNNMPPFLALNFCIALQGIFPPRA